MGDLDAGRVAAAAAAWGLQARYADRTGSTNADAAAWVPDLPPAGGLVVAGHQTAGRGRLERSWFSVPDACLLFSLALPRPFDPPTLGLLPLAAGVAACAAARAEGIDARLKWPNDVMVGDRKAGGILCESTIEGGTPWVVVGVGVNVNASPGDFPPELAGTATSLSAEAGRPLDRGALLESWLAAFLGLGRDLEQGRTGSTLAAYRPLCDTLGTRIRATSPSGTVEATALDVDDSGALLLDNGDRLLTADVVHLRLA